MSNRYDQLVGSASTAGDSLAELETGKLDVVATEKSADPADPAEGKWTMWMSDGTGAGDDGDIMMKITAGGSTKTVTLVDFSAS